MATVEQSSPSKVPILHPGAISPAIMRTFEHRCRNYFIHKKIPADDQVSLIIGSILDNRAADWISADRNRLIALLFDSFMIEFRTNYLAEVWEVWDFAVAIQSKNSLLCDTMSHLPNDKLRQQIGAGMELHLSKKVSSEKLNQVADFCKWLNEVKHCDETLRAEREEYERIAKENCDVSYHVNTPGDPSSRRTPYNNASATSSSAIPSVPCEQCPKLLDSERKLLNDNKGCVKCCHFFVNHHAAECPNDFPNPATYKTLVQADVDHVKCNRSKRVAAVTATTSPEDVSSSSMETPPHPVAAVLGMSRNPVAYVAPNASSVLDRSFNGDSDSSGTFSVSNPSLPKATTSLKDASPLHVSHVLVLLDEQQ